MYVCQVCLLIHQLAYFLDEFLFGTLGIAVVLIDNLSFTVDDEHIGNHLDAQLTLQFAVRVEEYSLVRPLMLVDEGFYFVDVLSLVDRDGHDLHARFLLPLVVDLADSGELTVAGLAPRGEERDDEGLAVIRQRVGTNGFSVDILQSYLWQLSAHFECHTQQHHCCKKHKFLHCVCVINCLFYYFCSHTRIVGAKIQKLFVSPLYLDKFNVKKGSIINFFNQLFFRKELCMQSPSRKKKAFFAGNSFVIQDKKIIFATYYCFYKNRE